MPTYEFRCRTCDSRFDVKRSMVEASAPAHCPSGHNDTIKLLSSFASVSAGSAAAASSPNSMSAAPSGGGCGSACGCAPG